MSKVTSKRQVTIPKTVADRYGIRAGDHLEWVPAGEGIRIVVSDQGPAASLSAEDRLDLFDQASARRQERQAGSPKTEAGGDRGWTREELYNRDGTD
jgi:AbrB family looped-hinge helix DNA binding protein